MLQLFSRVNKKSSRQKRSGSSKGARGTRKYIKFFRRVKKIDEGSFYVKLTAILNVLLLH